MALRTLAALALAATARATTTPLVSFDPAAPQALRHTWKSMNDPVMGGKSTGSVSVADDVLKFTGTCAIVPKLQAPGFITAVAGGGFFRHDSFVDVSSCQGLGVLGPRRSSRAVGR